MIFVILILVWCILMWCHPWIDKFEDYRGIKHTILWYTNFKGERKFVNLNGG